MSVPASEWVWCGYPGHFIAASACRLHLNTRVGRYRVSTVGDYRPDHVHEHGDLRPRRDDDPPDEIGHGRLYETMVFEVEGYGLHGEGKVIDWAGFGGEWGFDGYMTAEAAEAGHMRICRVAAEAQS